MLLGTGSPAVLGQEGTLPGKALCSGVTPGSWLCPFTSKMPLVSQLEQGTNPGPLHSRASEKGERVARDERGRYGLHPEPSAGCENKGWGDVQAASLGKGLIPVARTLPPLWLARPSPGQNVYAVGSRCQLWA